MDKYLERKIEEINIRLRLGKLDSLLLLIPTLLGIAFSLSQYYLRIVKEGEIAVFISILILTAGLPIYIGYYRGGIILDSIVERARGWIYLANGFLVFMILVVADILETMFKLEYVYPAYLLFFLAGICAGIINLTVAQRIGSKVLALASMKSSGGDKRTFTYTALSAFFLAGFTSNLASYSNYLSKFLPEEFSYIRSIDPWYSPSNVYERAFLVEMRFSTIFLIFIFFLFLLSEILARGYVVRRSTLPICFLLDLFLPIGFSEIRRLFGFSDVLLILCIASGTIGIALAVIDLKKRIKIDSAKTK